MSKPLSFCIHVTYSLSSYTPSTVTMVATKTDDIVRSSAEGVSSLLMLLL